MSERTSRRLFYTRTVLVVALALLLPVGTYLVLGSRIDHNARTAFVQQCGGNNQTRADFLAFVDSTVVRSVRALNATLAAPGASKEQKDAAVRNLAGLRVVQQDAHRREAPRPCDYPPKGM